MDTATIQVMKATAERLEKLARSTDRDAVALAEAALERFLEVEEWQMRAIDEAIAEADAGGPFIAHEDMVTYLDALARGEDPPAPPTFTRKPG